MKSTLVGIFATPILLAISAANVLAIEINTAPRSMLLARSLYTPANLVDAAYNDRLEGISGFGDLEANILADDITARDLVKAAIAQGRLTEAHLSDRGFLNAVEALMRTIISVDN